MVKAFGARVIEKRRQNETVNLKSRIIPNIIYFILSFFISNKSIYCKFFPFGVAFTAGVPYKSSFLTFFGSAVSYLVPGEINYSIKYIAAMVIIITVRWALKDLKIENNKFYSPIICSLALFLISVPVYVNGNFSSAILLNNFFESLLAGVYSFFFKESINIFGNYFFCENKNTSLIKDAKDLVVISMSVFALTLALFFVDLGILSLGRIISIYFILILCKAGGALFAGTASIILEFVFNFRFKNSFYNNNNYNLLFSSICALTAGLFSKLEKIKIAILYIFLNLLLKLNLLSELGPSVILSSFYESILASILFLITPLYILKKIIKPEMSDYYLYSNFSNLKKQISLKLKFLAESLKNIGSSLDVVSLRKKNNKRDLVKENIESIKEKFCSSCNLNSFCWNFSDGKMKQALEKALNNNKDQNNLENSYLEKRCLNFGKILNYIDLLHLQNNIKDTSSLRINEIKDCMIEQLKNIGELLEGTSLRVNNNYSVKSDAAFNLTKKLKKKGINPIYLLCTEGMNGKWKIELSIKVSEEEKFKKINFGELLEDEYKRKFDVPILTKSSEENLDYVILEKTKYKVKIFTAQHICKNGNFCGDSFKYFYTEDGYFVVVLSDGMGTGVRAAVEGAIVCEILSVLVKSGVNFEVALKIVNTTLLANPNEEALVAVDLVFINLNTGVSEFFKVGGASSIVKNKGQVQVLEESSLPIGILKDVRYSVEKIKLFNEDKVLIMSDGACYPKLDWITEKVKNWKNEPCEDIANFVVEKSLNYRKNDQDDDITVIALKLTSNN